MVSFARKITQIQDFVGRQSKSVEPLPAVADDLLLQICSVAAALTVGT
jgi:hypothetical protein